MLLSDFRMITKDLPDDYEIRLEGLEIVEEPFGPILVKGTETNDFEVYYITVDTCNTSIIIENRSYKIELERE